MSFVFYDTETTGTETTFDQILQFGAIKTDNELNEVDRFEMRCRLLPYVVPSPGAMRVTGVTIEQLLDPSLPSHYQMMRAIKAKLTEWSPAIFIGYNSIEFDEHLLRQAFYKTLHPPYLTNTNGNCRTDSLRMVRTVAKISPEILTIPMSDEGKQVFKLDQLAPANGFDLGIAHEAIADVEATIYLCKLISERAPQYWSNFVRFSKKATVNDYALDEEVFFLTDFFYGKPYSWMVTAIGLNPSYGSEIFVFDLSNDPQEFSAMQDDSLIARLRESPKPVRRMRTNGGAIVLSYHDTPEDYRSSLLSYDELKQRAEFIKNNQQFCQRLISLIADTQEEREPSLHVEEQIYDTFTSNADFSITDQFHASDWSDRSSLLTQISDVRLRSLGQRLIFAEAPSAMDEKSRMEYEIAIARRLMGSDGTVPWLTLPQAIKETKEMISEVNASEAALLKDLHDYLQKQAQEAKQVLER